MARRCAITGKGPKAGNQRSHSNRASKRRFQVNLITKRIKDPKTGEVKKMRIAASTLRTLTKQERMAAKKAQELMK